MRKAVVKKSNGLVENVIEIKEGAKWKPPRGCYLIDAVDASPGDTWDGTKFVKPEPEIVPEPFNPKAEVEDLKARIRELERKITK